MDENHNTLTSDDPRYRELFDPAKEAQASSGMVVPDLTPAMCALRDRAAVMRGSLRQLLNLPELHHAFDRERTHYTIFSYAACERAFRRLIILAGGGTTWRQLGITLHALLTNYELWQACCADHKLIEAAVEEAARWRPTDPTFPRLVQRDVEVEGVSIPAGSRVDLCLAAANRDPMRWSRPDVFDIYRPRQAHLAFGQGPHQCLGINVARQEMITAIAALMQRLPNMHLDRNAPAPQLVGGLEQRGVSALPVRLS